jgi:tRNA 2-selenouridine synthase
MVKSLPIKEFLALPAPLLDVRSPAEFADGHLPDAISFPLFSNEERAQVGTCYKEVGRNAAVELGFDLAGPRFGAMIRSARAIAPTGAVRVHCWRGGMRSGGVAWVLEMAGMQVTTLEGGYKAYRRWVRSHFSRPQKLVVLGGMTGTGKTQILQALAALGEQIIDLEALAHHRGSSFGSLDMPPQPTTEQFENRIGDRLAQCDPGRPFWLEAESRRIGICRIPEELFQQMEAAPTIEILRSLDERLDLLVEIYGLCDRQELITATERIRKRLGGQRTQAAIAYLEQGQLRSAFQIILDYYDRTYRYDLERRHKTIPQIDLSNQSPEAAARLLRTKVPLLLGSG